MRSELTAQSTDEERRLWKRQAALEAEEEGRNRGHEKRHVDIEGMIAEAFFHPSRLVLMDPEDPTVDVNELYQGRKRQMIDPKLMSFNCPLCHKTMAYELFVAHAEPCMVKWYKTLDPTLRTFAGPQSSNIIGVSATADADAPVEEVL